MTESPRARLDAELEARLKVALRAAEAAGAVLVQSLGRVQVANKSAVDLVTDADRASEQVILAELRASFPSDYLLAEESAGDPLASRHAFVAAPWAWAIDPLDGTTSFAHTYPAYCVSIGLCRFGEPVLGVVLSPCRKEVFVGAKGLAATCNGRPIGVSVSPLPAQALIGTGFPYDRRQRLPELMALLAQVLNACHDIRRSGSAALDLCDVASGRLDGFYEFGLRPWDLVGAVAVLEAAGGRVTDFDGSPHDVFAGRTVASNGVLHAPLLELLGSA